MRIEPVGRGITDLGHRPPADACELPPVPVQELVRTAAQQKPQAHVQVGIGPGGRRPGEEERRFGRVEQFGVDSSSSAASRRTV